MPLIESGLLYCVVHHGVVDVDQDDCDFADDDLDCVVAPLLYDTREVNV